MEIHSKIINGSCIDLREGRIRKERNAEEKSEHGYPAQLGLGAGEAGV